LVAYQTVKTYQACKTLTQVELIDLAGKLDKVRELRAVEVNQLCMKMDLGPGGDKKAKIKLILLTHFKGPQ